MKETDQTSMLMNKISNLENKLSDMQNNINNMQSMMSKMVDMMSKNNVRENTSIDKTKSDKQNLNENEGSLNKNNLQSSLNVLEGKILEKSKNLSANLEYEREKHSNLSENYDKLCMEKFEEKILSNLQTNRRKLSYEKFKMLNGKENLKVCYTGGPCAGKTTSITRVADQLREKGYTVFIVPEAASMIFSAGGNLDMSKYNDLQAVQFQYYLMQLQIVMEDIFTGLATINSNDKYVILCDRGIMDGKAYMTTKQWKFLEDLYDINTDRMRDKRYDLILHMVTAAKGKSENYDFENNNARWENPDFACELDLNLQSAWMKHPNFHLIANTTTESFQEKLNLASNTIFKELDIPVDLKFYKKLLLKNENNELPKLLEKELGVKLIRFLIKDIIFFEKDNSVTYIRKREQENQIATFVKCQKKFVNGKYHEKRRQVSFKEYIGFKELVSNDKSIGIKTRYTFIYNEMNYIMDIFDIGNNKSVSVLVIQGYDRAVEKTHKEIPEIIQNQIIGEIPNEKLYFFSEEISSKKHQNQNIRNYIQQFEN